jgi:hypothetical protein
MTQKIKELKKPEFCKDCPVDINTGKRMFCLSCSEKYIDYVCKCFQYAFGYIEVEKKVKKKEVIPSFFEVTDSIVEFEREQINDINQLEVVQ